jgi:hypothetical protein
MRDFEETFQDTLMSLMTSNLQNRVLNLHLVTEKHKDVKLYKQSPADLGKGSIGHTISLAIKELAAAEGIDTDRAQTVILDFVAETLLEYRGLVVSRIEELSTQLSSIYSQLPNAQAADISAEIATAFDGYHMGVSKIVAYLRHPLLEDLVDDTAMLLLTVLADAKRRCLSTVDYR